MSLLGTLNFYTVKPSFFVIPLQVQQVLRFFFMLNDLQIIIRTILLRRLHSDTRRNYLPVNMSIWNIYLKKRNCWISVDYYLCFYSSLPTFFVHPRPPIARSLKLKQREKIKAPKLFSTTPPKNMIQCNSAGTITFQNPQLRPVAKIESDTIEGTFVVFRFIFHNISSDSTDSKFILSYFSQQQSHFGFFLRPLLFD